MIRELTCDEAELLCIDRYSEVELDPDTIKALDQHLAGCAQCSAITGELDEIGKQIATTVRECPELNDPEGTEADVARVMAAINEYESQRATVQSPTARRTPWAAALLVAAVVFFAAGLGVGGMWTPGSSDGLHTAGEKETEELKAQRDEARAQAEVLKRDLETAQARIKELEEDGKKAKDD